MKRFLIICVLATAILACNKDKFKTQPQVEIKSLAPSEVVKGQLFTFTATVRDKEGDVHDSVLLVRKRLTGNILLSVDTIRYSIKDFGFSDNSTIDISALFSYGELRDGTIFENLESQDRNLSIGIIVRDNAGNKSDYVESGQIVLKKL